MTDNETSAYQRGYRAGLRRVEREEVRRRDDANDLWNRCYIAVLPIAMEAQGWTINDEPVNDTPSRIRLAQLWADQAEKNLRITA